MEARDGETNSHFHGAADDRMRGSFRPIADDPARGSAARLGYCEKSINGTRISAGDDHRVLRSTPAD